jgi:hypothetical protein
MTFSRSKNLTALAGSGLISGKRIEISQFKIFSWA